MNRLLRRTAVLLSLLAAVLPTLAQAWWNAEWSYRKELTLDAGPNGAALKGDVLNAPVLVRLHDGVVKFSDLAADGADLRFIAEDDKTPLKFHIEKFDPVFNLGFVWVQVPQLKPGVPVKVWMYYGNAKANPGGETRATYDSSQLLVWHFGERGTAVQDATAYGNHAAAPATPVESSLIGSGASFDGSAGLALPASATMPLAAGDARTWSLWIKPAAAVGEAVLYRQGDAASNLVIGLSNGSPYVAVTADGTPRRSSPLAALDLAGYHHLAVVADAQAVTLYVDGAASGTVPGPLPGLSGDAMLAPGYGGELDEFGIAKLACGADYLALLAGNEGQNDKLIAFGADEASGGGGYFTIILQSVTFDAWVVIGVLFVLAVISWAVMVMKARYTGQVASANEFFLEQYETLREDLVTLDSARPLSDDDRAELEVSSLHRLYEAGTSAIRKRFDAHGAAHGLSPEAIEAIRASVDAAALRESQRLNRGIVALTIAISGGPFIGLLGTVVGVMITFASIAASGDVNVNAIAPGISAALLATVAGMAVAIPALFGYNWLLGRIKDITANHAVFSDAFVTRTAELYPQRADAAPLHAVARA